MHFIRDNDQGIPKKEAKEKQAEASEVAFDVLEQDPE